MYHPILRPYTQRHLKKIGQADLVIGLPTYKNPKCAARVAKIALAGAQKYYPELRAVLINVDAGLPAATRQAVRQQVDANDPQRMIVSGRYDGLLGRGSAIAAALDAALALDAKAILILDSDTQSITPNWIKGLAHLIFEDKADLVLPRYQWSSLSAVATLSDLVVYPLFRALWGCSVRHPAAPDFALTPQLATAILDEDIWETEAATYGLTPWLTTYAVLRGWRVSQSALGQKRAATNGFEERMFEKTARNRTEQRRIEKHQVQFKTEFYDILSVMLRLVFEYRNQWKVVDNFYSLSTLTAFKAPAHMEPAPERNSAPLLDELALGWMEYRMLWRSILTPENLAQLESLAALPFDRFYFPPDLWAKIIYDFAVVFNKGERDPQQIVNAFFPIYQGRVAAFWQEIAGLSLVGREGTIAAQAVELEELRSYLKIRWHTYQPWFNNNEL